MDHETHIHGDDVGHREESRQTGTKLGRELRILDFEIL